MALWIRTLDTGLQRPTRNMENPIFFPMGRIRSTHNEFGFNMTTPRVVLQTFACSQPAELLDIT